MLCSGGLSEDKYSADRESRFFVLPPTLTLPVVLPPLHQSGHSEEASNPQKGRDHTRSLPAAHNLEHLGRAAHLPKFVDPRWFTIQAERVTVSTWSIPTADASPHSAWQFLGEKNAGGPGLDEEIKISVVVALLRIFGQVCLAMLLSRPQPLREILC